jgi:hypothetical protein
MAFLLRIMDENCTTISSPKAGEKSPQRLHRSRFHSPYPDSRYTVYNDKFRLICKYAGYPAIDKGCSIFKESMALPSADPAEDTV